MSTITIKITSLTLKTGLEENTVAIGKMLGTVYAGTTNIGCSSYSSSAAVSIGASGTLFAYATTISSGFTAASDKRDKADFKTITNL